FLWIHYDDAHAPHSSVAGVPRFGDRELDRYDQEIRWIDGHLAELLPAIDRALGDRDPLVIVTADHGERFGPGGRALDRAQALVHGTLWVPLLVRMKGLAPHRVRGAVSLLDLVPTVLDLAGLRPRDRFEGRSLVLELLGRLAADERAHELAAAGVGGQRRVLARLRVALRRGRREVVVEGEDRLGQRGDDPAGEVARDGQRGGAAPEHEAARPVEAEHLVEAAAAGLLQPAVEDEQRPVGLHVGMAGLGEEAADRLAQPDAQVLRRRGVVDGELPHRLVLEPFERTAQVMGQIIGQVMPGAVHLHRNRMSLVTML
ncbi:MAG: sulfatase-like hydrolase/transferase, partial [Solirubrobacterales bacterium]|nr:sulfatase-like hydrolase/transferase [Solirubrobacterales bacterium]